MQFAPTLGERATSGREMATILVVDDDVGVARTLRVVLDRAGYQVTVASDGRAAIEAVMRQPFTAIVSDIQMPGLSGVDFLREVRAYDLDVPVILMTGLPTLETAMEAVSLGALQYLPKPTPNDVLLRVVERACQLRCVARIKREALKLLGTGDTQAGDRAGLQASFDRMLEGMWMAFQPIVDAAGRRTFGYEALLRSREPSLPDPCAVLRAAERLDRTDDLGRRVRAMCADAFAKGPTEATLFVNLHPRDLLDAALYDARAPLTKIAHRVFLEITERSPIDEVKDVESRVSQLRRLGYRIAIDDLGAGYAGLSSFAQLEPELVKLDMSLVRDVHQSSIRQRLVGSMATLCNEMGIKMVAEGIETAQERDSVRELGCSLLQGYLFAAPGPPFPFPSMLCE